ncbi:MAG TPA: WYL domain-containing protein [Acidimicrobiales bacterium]|nr:WYL domain-containing protein [Acidimicrobiales bacterium]
MNRLERLINLVAALLQTERPLTADELRERVPGYAGEKVAFRRAFERDKETLRDLGVPIVVEPVPGTDPPIDGYRVPKEDYYLPDPGLADDELAALHLAATAVRLDVGSGVEALWKLGGEVAEAGPAPTTAVAALPGTDHLVPLFGAISARRPVAFTYRGRQRSLDPHRLSFRNGHWYLAAHDRAAGEERSYRLDRIESAVEAGEAGTAAPPAAGPASATPSPWELGGEEPVTARLLVDAGQAGWAEGHVGPSAVTERRPDGSVVLEVRVTNRDAFRSFVLGFLDHAEVLGPPELRADVTRWLEGLCPS